MSKKATSKKGDASPITKKKQGQSAALLADIPDMIETKKGDASPITEELTLKPYVEPTDEEMQKLVAFLENPANDGKPLELKIRLLSLASNVRREIKDDEEFQALKRSIDSHGLIQPLVIQLWEGKPTVTAGHRRFTACSELGWEKIRVIARTKPGINRTELQIYENIHRSDLSPIEYCEALDALMKENPDWTIADLCTAIGQSDRKTVGYYLKIAQWPEEWKEAAIERQMPKRLLIAIAKRQGSPLELGANEGPGATTERSQAELSVFSSLLRAAGAKEGEMRAYRKAMRSVLSLSSDQLLVLSRAMSLYHSAKETLSQDDRTETGVVIVPNA